MLIREIVLTDEGVPQFVKTNRDDSLKALCKCLRDSVPLGGDIKRDPWPFLGARAR